MPILPIARFRIATPLDRTEVVQRLRAIARPRRSLSEAIEHLLERDDVPFIGTVEAHGFKLRRRIRYENSFLPTIVGRIDARVGGSEVRLFLRPSGFAIAFLIVWFALTVPDALAAARIWWEGGKLSTMDLTSLAFVAGGYLLAQAGFWPEAWKARNRLRQELRGA
jgi:hypothetical protein